MQSAVLAAAMSRMDIHYYRVVPRARVNRMLSSTESQSSHRLARGGQQRLFVGSSNGSSNVCSPHFPRLGLDGTAESCCRWRSAVGGQARDCGHAGTSEWMLPGPVK